ncbi:MAG: [protein-PII] uridylyltransferase [Alphaproteobacteria bacterium]
MNNGENIIEKQMLCDNIPIKDILNQSIEKNKQKFKADLNGIDCSKSIADDFNCIIKSVFKKHDITPTGISIIAVGGYGSGYNAQHSDIDLLFLCDDIEKQKDNVEKILYTLWDTGAKISQLVHTVKTASSEMLSDHVFLTTVLSMRLICGDKKLFANFDKDIKENILTQGQYNYIITKLKERSERHKKYGVSRYLLEPNVKNGKGGLRDIQTLMWITKYLYDIDNFKQLYEKKLITENEMNMFEHSFSFLWSVRLSLHFINNSASEVLNFQSQIEVAEMLGYKDTENKKAVEEFMGDYIDTVMKVSTLTRVIINIFESNHNVAKKNNEAIDDNFQLIDSRIALIDNKLFEKQPTAIFDLFYLVATKKYKLHYQTYQLLRDNTDDFSNDKDAQTKFLKIIMCKSDVGRTLRLMNEVGLLGQLIPEWKVIFCQMQYNMYHSYTTDEHTIRAVELLSKIDNKEMKDEHQLSTKLMQNITDKSIIYMAVLLHDIAKGLGGDHSILGEDIAEKICKRWGYNTSSIKTISWLVRYHLFMSNTSQRRDLSDPKTIADFTDIVDTQVGLDLLTILTVVDTRAVGPNVWNDWKKEVITNLYNLSVSYLSTGDMELLSNDIADKKQEVEKKIAGNKNIDKEKSTLFIEAMTPQYLLNFNVDEIVWHIETASLPYEVNIAIHHDEKGYTKVLLNSPDKNGLMADMTGALAILGANIIKADIYTFKQIGSVNIFYVHDNEGNLFDKDFDEIEKIITASITGKLNIDEKLTANKSILNQTKDLFAINNRININNDASNTSTIIEVRTKDTKGLLYKISRCISELGLKIETSKITTYGERVVDVFYIKDNYGFKLHRKQTQRTVIDKLNKVLEEIENENI